MEGERPVENRLRQAVALGATTTPRLRLRAAYVVPELLDEPEPEELEADELLDWLLLEDPLLEEPLLEGPDEEEPPEELLDDPVPPDEPAPARLSVR